MTRGQIWLTLAAGMATHGGSPKMIAAYTDLLVAEYEQRFDQSGENCRFGDSLPITAGTPGASSGGVQGMGALPKETSR